MKYFTPLKIKDVLSLIGLIAIGFGWLLIDQIFLHQVYQRFVALIILLIVLIYLQFLINKPINAIHYANTLALIIVCFTVIISIIMHMIINHDFSSKTLLIWIITALMPYLGAFIYLKTKKKI